MVDKKSANSRRRMMAQNSTPGKVQAERENNIKQEKAVKRPLFFKNRGTFAFMNGNYITSLIIIIMLVGNLIGRLIVGTYSLAIPNVIFIIMYMIMMSYIEPLDFASDKNNYRLPKLNNLYVGLQKISTVLLTRLGKNLTINPASSLNSFLFIVIPSYFIALLFYNSNFELLSIPFLLIYVARIFATNKFKEQVGKLTLINGILMALLLINIVLSIFWKTPVDFSLIIIITLLNTIKIWFNNTELYEL